MRTLSNWEVMGGWVGGRHELGRWGSIKDKFILFPSLQYHWTGSHHVAKYWVLDLALYSVLEFGWSLNIHFLTKLSGGLGVLWLCFKGITKGKVLSSK